MNNFKTITHEELREKIDGEANFTLLEITPSPEFKVGHLPRAKNLPMDQIENRASDLITGKDSKVVVYGSGTDSDVSEKAAKKLASMGYTKVYHFAGGKSAWNETKTPALAV
ncbi:MAG: rhodanese-like domain-containing protein [Gemmatimonadota bacterium]